MYRKFYKTQDVTLSSEKGRGTSSYKLTNQPPKIALTTNKSCSDLPYYISNK